MSTHGNTPRPQSPKAGDGLITKLVKKMILRDGEIAAVSLVRLGTQKVRYISGGCMLPGVPQGVGLAFRGHR